MKLWRWKTFLGEMQEVQVEVFQHASVACDDVGLTLEFGLSCQDGTIPHKEKGLAAGIRREYILLSLPPSTPSCEQHDGWVLAAI